MRIGSLCTGIAGLELGLQHAGMNTETVFVADIDPAACHWLDANLPDTPNIGDLTQTDQLPNVDLITAGFPCQPVSTAGTRKGLNDDRWIFNDICRLASRMETRPRLFLENVPGLLTANNGHAMARVVHDLANIGYHITWGTLPAAAVGAPHRRNRWWGLAYPADTSRIGRHTRPRPSSSTTRRVGRHGSRHNDRTTAADTTSAERRGPQQQHLSAPSRPAAEPRERACSLAERFGAYANAVNRWEHILGRTAPDPTDNGRLNPAFVEWMMGYPEEHVTNTLTRRTHALHALGNAVVPQCAAHAYTQLTQRLNTAT